MNLYRNKCKLPLLVFYSLLLHSQGFQVLMKSQNLCTECMPELHHPNQQCHDLPTLTTTTAPAPATLHLVRLLPSQGANQPQRSTPRSLQEPKPDCLRNPGRGPIRTACAQCALTPTTLCATTTSPPPPSGECS